jgi:hypothetical protein
MRATAVRSAITSMVVGMALNIVCWWVNGGMPVMGWAQRTGWAHHVATNADRLPWLWDRIAVFGFIVSVGDLLLAAGVLLSSPARRLPATGSASSRAWSGPARPLELW